MPGDLHSWLMFFWECQPEFDENRWDFREKNKNQHSSEEIIHSQLSEWMISGTPYLQLFFFFLLIATESRLTNTMVFNILCMKQCVFYWISLCNLFVFLLNYGVVISIHKRISLPLSLGHAPFKYMSVFIYSFLFWWDLTFQYYE